ncbi:MAG: hypothetical protein ACM31C_17315 [Acidobacteriota bacterium]
MSSRAALALVVACAHPLAAPVANAVREGVSIAIYKSASGGYGVIDDRRWIDSDGKTLDLARIDPGASLASLVIEPSGGLRVGRCTRDRVPELVIKKQQVERYAADIHCTAEGAPGRYLVRVLYVSTTLTYTAEHEIAMTAPEHATVTSRFAIATPTWRERADVVLYDGLPGGDRLPREVARGELPLDGATAVLGEPPRELPAHLRRIYDGALPSRDAAPTDALWGRDSVQAVWVWLELPRAQIAPGPLRVHVELAGEATRDVDVPPSGRHDSERELRLPLWVDGDLHGMRQRFGDYSRGAQLTERLLLSVSNLGTSPREVWVEEHLRPSRHHELERAWPRRLAATGDVVRTRLVVAPGKIERVGFTVAYEF